LRSHLLDIPLGARSSAADRGLNGASLFTIGPTMIDLLLVCIILLWDTSVVFSIVIMSTMLLYMFVTVKMIAWRTKFRRGMIETDNQANDRAVNSLMNFETVKYFGMESSEVYHGPIHLFQCSDLIEHHAGELLQGELACNAA
jgi:ABC-type transport system involved in Fe-S cluster assembly fused permease/ATPase subunit